MFSALGASMSGPLFPVGLSEKLALLRSAVLRISKRHVKAISLSIVRQLLQRNGGVWVLLHFRAPLLRA